MEMIKQLQTLRQSFAQMTATTNPAPQKDSPKEPIVRSRPSVSNRINLISRAPDFENIDEGEEADDDEEERCLEPSLVPLPDDDDDLSPRTSHSPSTSPSPEVQAEPQPNVTKRKPTRRQSGLLGPSRARISLSPAADDEEEVVGMLADREEEETTSVVPATLKSRKRTKNADGNLRSGLADVTNSPPRRENIQKGITSVLAEAEDGGLTVRVAWIHVELLHFVRRFEGHSEGGPATSTTRGEAEAQVCRRYSKLEAFHPRSESDTFTSYIHGQCR